MGIAKRTALPVLDLARLDASPAEKQAFLSELRETAHDLGFFYLSGHGIDCSDAGTDALKVIETSLHDGGDFLD